MLKNVYEGLNARPKVYLLKEYFCEMYPTCVSSKLCEFICKYQENKKNIFHATFGIFIWTLGNIPTVSAKE